MKNICCFLICLLEFLAGATASFSVEAAKCLNRGRLVDCETIFGNNVPDIPAPIKELYYCRNLINCDPNQFNINSAILVARQSGIIHNEVECLQFTENVIEETRSSYGNAIPYFEEFAARGRSQGRDACAYQFQASPPTNQSSPQLPQTLPQPRPAPIQTLPQPRPTPSQSLPQPNLSSICQTNMMWCNVGQFAPIGTFCWCNSQFGQLQGQIVPQ